MSERQGLPSVNDSPGEIVDYYSKLEPEMVITPGDRRRLWVVAEEVVLGLQGDTPLGEPPAGEGLLSPKEGEVIPLPRPVQS